MIGCEVFAAFSDFIFLPLTALLFVKICKPLLTNDYISGYWTTLACTELVTTVVQLTIFLLLCQDGNLLAFWQVKQKQHCLLTDDVCKVHIVDLCGDRQVRYTVVHTQTDSATNKCCCSILQNTTSISWMCQHPSTTFRNSTKNITFSILTLSNIIETLDMMTNGS